MTAFFHSACGQVSFPSLYPYFNHSKTTFKQIYSATNANLGHFPLLWYYEEGCCVCSCTSLLWTHIFSFLGFHLGIESLDHRRNLFSVLWGAARTFHRNCSTWHLTSSEEGRLLCILPSKLSHVCGQRFSSGWKPDLTTCYTESSPKLSYT